MALFFITLTLPLSIVNAQEAEGFDFDFSIDVETQYQVQDNGQAKVKQILSIYNETDITPDEITINLAGSRQSGLRVETQDSGQVVSKIDDNSANISLNGLFSGYSAQWSMSLDYDTNLFTDLGEDARAAVLPGLVISSSDNAKWNFNSNSYLVSAPSSWGSLETVGQQPSSAVATLGQQILTFKDDESDIAKPVILKEGTPSILYKRSSSLKGTSFWWSDKEIELPISSANQSFSLNYASTLPLDGELDSLGNTVLKYRLSPNESIDLDIEGVVKLSSQKNHNEDYNIPVTDIDSSLINTDGGWSNFESFDLELEAETGPVFIERVLDLALEEGDPSGQDFSEAVKYNAKIAKTLRQNNVPARIVAGKAFTDGKQLFTEPIDHVWVEIQDSSRQWVTLDVLSYSNMKQFGYQDGLHIVEQVISTADDEPIEGVEYTFENKTYDIDGSSAEYQLSGVRNVIIPFLLSVDTATAQAPYYGCCEDVSALRTSDKSEDSISIDKSLAPGEKFSIRSLSVGPQSTADDQIQLLKQADADFSSAVAAAGYESSYKPFIGILIVAALSLIGLKEYKKR